MSRASREAEAPEYLVAKDFGDRTPGGAWRLTEPLTASATITQPTAAMMLDVPPFVGIKGVAEIDFARRKFRPVRRRTRL